MRPAQIIVAEPPPAGVLEDAFGPNPPAGVPAGVVKADAFGPVPAAAGSDWPVTWVHSELGPGRLLSVVSDRTVGTITRGGRPVARTFSDDWADYCVIGDLLPARTGARAAQAESVFDELGAVLETAGMQLGDLVRTWFFLDQILDWYPEFNAVRTRRYAGLGTLPASTGVGGRNRAGAALVASAIALRPRCEQVSVTAVPSPHQDPPTSYGSAFSRAIEIRTPAGVELFVSGTASIDAQGLTTHVGDTAAQVRETLRVVSALLESRGLGLGQVTRSVVYFARAADAVLWDRTRHGALGGVGVVSRNTLCRPDLGFEIELDARD